VQVWTAHCVTEIESISLSNVPLDARAEFINVVAWVGTLNEHPCLKHNNLYQTGFDVEDRYSIQYIDSCCGSATTDYVRF
jgi:hypothetical protein